MAKNLDPLTIGPAVAVAQIAATLLASDPRYHAACDKPDPEVNGRLLALHVNVAASLLEMSAGKFSVAAGPQLFSAAHHPPLPRN